MFGILLITIATLFSEAGTSIGKNEVAKHRQSILGMGFLNSFWAVIILAAIVLFIPKETFFGNLFGEFYFSFETLHLILFSSRVLLEILLINLVLKAAVLATRSAFSFIRMITIPFLILVDIYLGFEVSIVELGGILIILCTVLFLVTKDKLDHTGIWYSIISSLLAVVTITIYKYNITNFSSVAGEQLVMSTILLVYLFSATFYSTKKNPIHHLSRPRVLIQSLSIGVGSVIGSFAFMFAPSSVITAGKRTSAILWSIISGKLFFNEKNFQAKILSLCLLAFGLFLLTNPPLFNIIN